MTQQKRYSPEFHERAVRLVQELQKEGHSEWSAMQSISEKLGCTPESVRRWVRQAQRNEGKRPGPTTFEQDELKQLRRENRELKRANEILKSASAFFAQAELDRRLK
jgi:transposase